MSVETIQALASRLQTIVQQVQAIDAQIREIDGTLEALSSQAEGRPVYRQVGPLLLEVEDRDSLAEELTISRKTLTEHLSRLQERESDARREYETAVDSFES